MDKKIKDVIEWAEEVLDQVNRTIHHEYLGDTSIAESQGIEDWTVGLAKAIEALKADPPRSYDFGLTGDREDTLEQMVDQGQLANVLDSLAQVCHNKGAHLDHAWDDVAAAGRWAAAAGEIEELAAETSYPWIIHRTGPRLMKSNRREID